MSGVLMSVLCSSQNPQADLQAQDRCHRIGQTKPVVVYRLVTANTIDQKILERATNKRKLEQMVIHKSESESETRCITGVGSSETDSTLLVSPSDKFKGAKSELNQSKSCIDLNELMELLKARRSEW